MLTAKGMNSSDLRQRNRGLVLKLVAMQEKASRISITRETGLSKMTVTNIVSELLKEQYLIQTSSQKSSGAGRNPVLLDISPEAPVILGLYISRSYIEAALSNLKGSLLWRRSIPLKQESASTLKDKLTGLANAAMHSAKGRLLGVGVSIIGPLEENKGVLLNPTNFYGIEDFPVKDILESACGTRVYVSNDTNAAALAELLLGSGKEMDNFIYIGISNGIGAGIVSQGELYQNGSGYAGELGHTTIKYDGMQCACGNRGCLELYANIDILREKLAQACGLSANEIYPQNFEELALREECYTIFSDMAIKLSYALINAVNLFNPQKILLGHEGGMLPQKCISQMEEYVNGHILAAKVNKIKIERSYFGGDAPLYGSVCCVLDKLFNGDIFL